MLPVQASEQPRFGPDLLHHTGHRPHPGHHFCHRPGLGYGSIIEEKIKSNLSVNQQFADMVLNFINSYLEHTQSGIFIGFGLLLLLYTVVQLTANIEIALNSIWNVKNQRSIYRQITDYISVFPFCPS